VEVNTTSDDVPRAGWRVMLVTGASGFIGGAVIARAMRDPELRVKGAMRRAGLSLVQGAEVTLVRDLARDTDWKEALSGADVVVHTAARVHVMRDPSIDPLTEFRRVNVAGTLNLATQAAAAGARRFVFISSIKANGEQTLPGSPYSAADVPAPVDPYGISKLEAEQGLRDLSRECGMEVVIIRPVLVYGPGVGGNFRAIMRVVSRGIPLPLGAIHNRRSLVSLDNLVDLIMTCVHYPRAAGGTFFASDGEDLSTTELLRRIAAAMARPARLIPVPERVLWTAARLLGKTDVAQRLLGSLQVDITQTRTLLGWTPPVSVDASLERTTRHFLTGR